MKLTEALKIILEFNDENIQYSMRDVSQDEIGKRNLDDTRKPKLTLRDLNRLKKIRATRKLAQLQKKGLLQLMYGQGGGEEEAASPF